VAVITPCAQAMAVYPEPMNLALLGGGRMGEALARGLIAAGWDREAIAIAEIDSERRRVLEEHLPGVRIVPSPAWAAADVEVVVIALKHADVAAALEVCTRRCQRTRSCSPSRRE
jgi:pyrroline-5-carboxylate reductase